MARRFIMCMNRPVFAFQWDPHRGFAIGSGTVIDPDRIPLELITHGKPAVYASRIDDWWRHRAIPTTRDGIRHVLDSLGLQSTTELLDRSHALSLSDRYWVKDEDSTLTWEQVNFFDNPFDEGLGLNLLSVSQSHEFSFDAPDSSTGGDLPKRWAIADDGERILIKGGRTGQEPINETIASELCDGLGINAIRYRLGEYENRPVSICGEMLHGDQELISARQILEAVKRDNRLSAREQWVAAAEALGCPRAETNHATDDWLLVDYLMRNIDRHYNNFGLIRDVKTLEVHPAPIFDTGASLWAGELRVDNRDYKAKPFYATVKTPTARRQLELVQDWRRFDLTVLDGWPDTVAERLSKTGLLPDARTDLIHDVLKTRVADVKNKAAAATSGETAVLFGSVTLQPPNPAAPASPGSGIGPAGPCMS